MKNSFNSHHVLVRFCSVLAILRPKIRSGVFFLINQMSNSKKAMLVQNQALKYYCVLYTYILLKKSFYLESYTELS